MQPASTLSLVAFVPPLLLVFQLPHAFIVPVCVGGALFGHVVLTRALLRRRG